MSTFDWCTRMKNKKMIYVEKEEDVLDVLSEIEKSPKKKHIPIILLLLGFLAIIVVGYFSFHLKHDYQDAAAVLDEVFYTDLIPGKEYTVKGTLMVKETGEPLTVDGEKVTAEKTFTAEEADGSILLEFTFNSDSLALEEKQVAAFEIIEYADQAVNSRTYKDKEAE